MFAPRFILMFLPLKPFCVRPVKTEATRCRAIQAMMVKPADRIGVISALSSGNDIRIGPCDGLLYSVVFI
jgi:hypothetical protein